VISFQISTNHSGKHRTIKVFVYDSKKELRTAAHKYSLRNYEPEDEEYYNSAGALTHSFQRFKMAEDGIVMMHENSNIIRLSKDQIGSETICHESAHAALHIYHIDCVKEADVAEEHINSGNEQLCYLVGDITKKIVNKLYEYGCYDKV
jgi:hypothetical protein